MEVLLSTAYLAPIQYFSKIAQADKVFIESLEHFPKQTYRNRCMIYSANGPLTLSIPVKKKPDSKIFMKDVRIDYASNWQKIHFKAIESAYRCSPFYEYYIDEFMMFWEQHFEFLLDYNQKILVRLCDILKISSQITFTSDFQKNYSNPINDLRYYMHPKEQKNTIDYEFKPPVYRQVFESKFGFIANLSMLDLLFNTGPEALSLLHS